MATIAAIFAEALQHHQAGNLHLAKQLYQKILAADGNHADAHHLLGVVAYREGQFEQAASSIGRALSLNPGNAVYHANLGLVWRELSNLGLAMSSFRDALRIDPCCAEAHLGLGNIYRIQGMLDDAIKHCLLAICYRPNYPEARNNLSNVLLAQNKVEDAVNHLRDALRMRPDFPEAHNNLADALLRQGKAEEAVVHCRHALRYRPGFPEALYNLAIAFEQQDNLNEAIEHYRQALALNPEYVGAHQKLSSALLKTGRSEEAEIHAWQARRLSWLYHAPQMASQAYRPPRLAYEPGEYGDDERLKYILYFLDVRGWRVLEIGPQEGHHSLILDKMGVRALVGVEARLENVNKCNLMKERHHLDNTIFVQQNLEHLYEGREAPKFAGPFDLVFCCGVLYHLPNPAMCLEWFRTQAKTLFLATAYYEPKEPAMFPTGEYRYQPLTLRHRGKTFYGMGFEEAVQHLGSAMSPLSFWATDAQLLEMLADAGYATVSVLGKDIQNDKPHITILAEG
jgi:tetratricopeptide (TPR) repeat protein